MQVAKILLKLHTSLSTSISQSHYLQVHHDAGRPNQPVSVCPISFNTQSRLINLTLCDNNLTAGLTGCLTQCQGNMLSVYEDTTFPFQTRLFLSSCHMTLKILHTCMWQERQIYIYCLFICKTKCG